MFVGRPIQADFATRFCWVILAKTTGMVVYLLWSCEDYVIIVIQYHHYCYISSDSLVSQCSLYESPILYVCDQILKCDQLVKNKVEQCTLIHHCYHPSLGSTIFSCWPTLNNRNLYRQIASYIRLVDVGDHRVG